MAYLPPFHSAAERWFWTASGAFLACCAGFALVLTFDDRLLADESVWSKPLKFAVSLALHYATVAIVVRHLSLAIAQSSWMAWVAIVSIAAASFEMSYIALQGARALPSHFYTETPFYAAMYASMAGAAILVLMPFGVLGIATAADGGASWSGPVRFGTALGLLVSTALTLVVAFRLGANMSHFIGATPAEDVRIPLLGWSLRGADLRPAHFMALHAAQAIPVVALILATLLPSHVAIGLTVIWAALWIGATLWLFRAALIGHPLEAVFSP